MKFDHDYNLTTIVEKPEPNQIANFTDADQKIRVSMNIFLFDGRLFVKIFGKVAPAHPTETKKNYHQL